MFEVIVRSNGWTKLTDLEIMLQNWLPAGTVTEEVAASPDSLSISRVFRAGS